MTTVVIPALAAPAVFGAARFDLGAFWVHEGIFKYGAHFGRADILLIADSAKSNSRVPDYFTMFVVPLLRSAPVMVGFLVPLIETALGVALVLGVLTLPVALAGLLNLMVYWSSDQLITRYPVMGVLSAVVITWPVLAARYSTTSLIVRAMMDRRWVERLSMGPLRRWL